MEKFKELKKDLSAVLDFEAEEESFKNLIDTNLIFVKFSIKIGDIKKKCISIDNGAIIQGGQFTTPPKFSFDSYHFKYFASSKHHFREFSKDIFCNYLLDPMLALGLNIQLFNFGEIRIYPKSTFSAENYIMFLPFLNATIDFLVGILLIPKTKILKNPLYYL